MLITKKKKNKYIKSSLFKSLLYSLVDTFSLLSDPLIASRSQIYLKKPGNKEKAKVTAFLSIYLFQRSF